MCTRITDTLWICSIETEEKPRLEIETIYSDAVNVIQIPCNAQCSMRITLRSGAHYASIDNRGYNHNSP